NCSRRVWRRPWCSWTRSSWERLRMQWSAATAGTARCRRRCTGFGRGGRSRGGWRWTCCGSDRPETGPRRPRPSTRRGRRETFTRFPCYSLCFVLITDGKTSDVTVLDKLVIEPGAFYVKDRGYIDFARLHRFTRNMAFFVTRAKRNMDYSRRCYRPVDKSTGLRSDQTIILTGPKTSKAYPVPLRRVSFCDPETEKRFVFLSNNFILPALTIARIYKCRWQVELFFKWIKQNLRIKTFYGTSPNAVKTQVWIAISGYVLVAIVRKELKLDKSPGEILQILSITLCEKTPIFTVLSGQSTGTDDSPCCNQLPLFDFLILRFGGLA